MRRLGLGAIGLACVMAMSGRGEAQATPAATGPGTAIRIGGGVSAFQADYGERHIGGGYGWVDVNPYWRAGIESEARWLRVHNDAGVTEATYLIGPRVAIRSGRFEPYVKALAGGARFSFPFGYGSGTYFVVAGGGGVDLNIGGRFQVRAIDVEYQRWPQFSFGALSPYGISTGISFRLLRSATRIGPHEVGSRY